VPPPPFSRATKLPNKVYEWRGQKIRYQVAEPAANSPTSATSQSAPTVILVHGLFVNSDHWRKTLKGLSEGGYRTFAIDLLGCGYSSKPPASSVTAKSINGENLRFIDQEISDETQPSKKSKFQRYHSILRDVTLGTPQGGSRKADVNLRHPLSSPYNFYTWAEQINDFCRDVILPNSELKTTTIVCNSIGTISSLQAIVDSPDLFDGLFIVNPNFRELHSAEFPLPELTMPIVQTVQACLRNYGQPLFQALAKPDIVGKILREPYHIHSAIDEELVDVLLTPLLTPGAADVVFDLLSYSAGPLPEQLLSDPSYPQKVPVWVCYGKEDPWTPAKRVDRMLSLDPVERVIPLHKVGHCPHDEAPEQVNPLLLDFLKRVKFGEKEV